MVNHSAYMSREYRSARTLCLSFSMWFQLRQTCHCSRFHKQHARRQGSSTLLPTQDGRRRASDSPTYPRYVIPNTVSLNRSSIPLTRSSTDNFEAAALPTTSPEERRRLLSFVVCGGGPTGVEAAAEIYDLCQEDIMRYYPKICREEVSIHVIQSREHILNTVCRIAIHHPVNDH